MPIGFVRFLKGVLLENATDTTKQAIITVSDSATPGTTTTINLVQTSNRALNTPDVDGDILARNSFNSTVDVNSSRIINLLAPTQAGDAVNKTYADNIMLGTEFTDTNFRVHNNSDVTKTLALDISAVTAATTRTITMADSNINLSLTTSGSFANATLSNLGTTALNADLIGASDLSLNIGSVLKRVNTIFISNVDGGTSTLHLLTDDVTSGTSGNLSGVTGAATSGSATSGQLFLHSGNKTGGTTGGTGNTNINSGDISTNTTGDTGALTVKSGNTTSTSSSSDSGPVVFESGNSTSGNSGSVTVKSGSAGLVRGDVILDAPTINTTCSVLLNNGSLKQSSFSEFQELVSVSVASSGYQRFYPKTDHEFYSQDSAGNESVFGVPSGVILDFGGTSAPSGYLLCDGSAVSRTTYARLFTAIGVTWGAGDTTTTFNVPDLRGRATFGKDDMGGSAANRVTNAVSGIIATTLGATGGDEHVQQHTHTQDPHKHRVLGNTGGPALVLGSETDNFLGAQGGGSYTNGFVGNSMETTTATNQNFGTGASQNMPPVGIVNKIIKY